MRKLIIILALATVLCGGCGPKEEKEEIVLTIPGSGGVQLKMRLIPAGTFTMGSPESEKDRQDDEGQQHKVTITKPFYMGVYEVTQEQWEAVMGNNPSRYSDNPKNPVERVSWNNCQEFIQKLNTMNLGTFSLPTEAEWEYASRAGSTTRFPWGDDPNYSLLGQYAWYDANSSDMTHPVGQKKPNAWGLYDMHGNVYEWCSDWKASYSAESQIDPQGTTAGSYRVIRGGGLSLDPEYCRSADRNSGAPTIASPKLGFRLVRTSQ